MARLEGEGDRLTGRGYLNRKLVERLMDSAEWPGCNTDVLRAICKVFNEHDFIPAMYLHVLLKLAGLARRERVYLKLTRKGRAMLPEDAAGRLHATLFRTTFARYNLAYLDGSDLPDMFSPQVSLILFLIGQLDSEWRSSDALRRSVTIPLTRDGERRSSWASSRHFSLRVLRYLCWFGLPEEAHAANDSRKSSDLFRKTPRFDQALSFTLT